MEAEREVLFPDTTVEIVSQAPFAIRRDASRNLFIVTSGIGTVNAAAATQYVVNQLSPGIIINIGSAGGVSDRVDIGRAYFVERSVFFDVDVTDFGYSYGEFPYNGKAEYPLTTTSAGRSHPTDSSGTHSANTIEDPITCASGNRFVTDFVSAYSDKLLHPADLVDMELAGIVHTLSVNSYIGQVFSIKGVSDKADQESTDTFKQTLEKAMRAVGDKFDLLLETIR